MKSGVSLRASLVRSIASLMSSARVSTVWLTRFSFPEFSSMRMKEILTLVTRRCLKGSKVVSLNFCSRSEYQ